MRASKGDAATLRFRATGSVELIADVHGPPDGPPVLLLHGGGQTRHAWGSATSALGAAGLRAIAVDQRGHGESAWAPDGDYSIDAYAADVRAIADQVGSPVALVGASLGGLAGLLAAGEPPGLPCTALVLVDVTPRMERDGRDRIGAFMRSRPDGFASLEEAADEIARFLPHRPRPKDAGGLSKNLRLDPDGRYRWHWDPAFLAGRIGSDASKVERYESAVRALDVPLLLVRGAASEIVSEAGAAQFLALAPSAEYVDVPHAAHMVAGDRNDVFREAVVEFLVRILPGRR